MIKLCLIKGNLEMLKNKGITRSFFVICLVLVGCPMAVAAERSLKAIIIGGSPKAAKFKEFAKDYQRISVSPFLAVKSGEFKYPPIMLNTNKAARILGKTMATAVWEFGPKMEPSLHLMPFDVHAVTQMKDWSRVGWDLSPKDKNTLVFLGGPAQTKITTNLSIMEMKKQWENMFKEYPAVRALGLTNVVYVEPIAKGANKQRAAVFRKHAKALRLLKEDPQKYRTQELFDGIFSEITAAKANNNEIALYRSVWKSDISKLFEIRNLNNNDVDKIKGYVGSLEAVLNAKVKQYQCTVTISTSNGPGAAIKFFKSLLGPKGERFFGITQIIRQIERASWTFVSYRIREGRSVKTGSVENVNCHDHKSTLSIVIQEN